MLGEDSDASALSRLEREVQACEARADDEEVAVVCLARHGR